MKILMIALSMTTKINTYKLNKNNISKCQKN